MPVTRRTQLLMDPKEFRRLRALARRKKTTVAELIRSAVRATYLEAQPDRKAIVESILAMKLPIIEWKPQDSRSHKEHARPTASGALHVRLRPTRCRS